VLAAGLLLVLAVVAAGLLLGDRRDAWLARLDGLRWPGAGERQAAGDVALEEDLVTDLAAAARALPADGPAAGRDGAEPPASPPDELREAARGAGIASRCATPGLADQRACLLARLIEHDVELNRVYAALVGALRREAGVADDVDPPAVQQLRVEQRQWLVDRDEACAREGRGREGALWAEPRARCLGERGRVRADQLARRLAALRDGA
jgi:uncharacterized protein YecT (DUF1311 family)